MTYSKHPLAQGAMKTALFGAPPGVGGKLLENPGVQAALAGTALSAGVAGISGGVSYLKDVYDRSQSFKQMLELTPSLREHGDQAAVKRYFNSLHRVNPHFMNDPSVAGALVHRVIEAQDQLGGAGQPSSALASMVSELAKGRADLSRAVAEENRGGGFAGRIEPHLHRNVEAGIKAFHELRENEWKTQAELRQKELQGSVDAAHAKARGEIEQLEAHRAAMGEAFGKQKAHMEGSLRGMRHAMIFQRDEAKQPLTPPPPMGAVRVESKGSPGGRLIPAAKVGPGGGAYVSPEDHPYPPSGGIANFKRR
jgi:hypothetical protein